MAAIAASPTEAPAVVVIDPATAEVEVVRRSRPTPIDPAYLSTPTRIDFPTTGGRTAHALFYPPAHPAAAGPPGELPPLIVTSHGGPTSQASTALNLRTQFWTSRGFAVVDVDYGGSSGYGRAYRRRSTASGAWSTSTTAWPPPATWPTRARSTAGAWPSGAAAPAASPPSWP